jgi:DNA replication and repair protein RecF
LAAEAGRPCWIERLALTNFRNYAEADLAVGPEPVVLIGANGAGKTNLLEAVSMLAPGQGLRRAPYAEIACHGGAGDWAVAATVHGVLGAVEIGTGLAPGGIADGGARIVRIDRRAASGTGVLAEHVEMIWLTPAMDALFTGPAGDRRRFLDRLILCFDPGYRSRLSAFERAMRQRNRLLEIAPGDGRHLDGLEMQLAETGVAIAAARLEVVAHIERMILARRARDAESPFPWAALALEGRLENELKGSPAVDVEDRYLHALAGSRERDRAAGRTLEGPHRSDLQVDHGPKAMPARKCSTGEQKALLVGLVLAHAELVTGHRGGLAPILLLDEIAAHLDVERRAALFAEILRLGAQAWMTGTDEILFTALVGRARFGRVGEGGVQGLARL